MWLVLGVESRRGLELHIDKKVRKTGRLEWVEGRRLNSANCQQLDKTGCQFGKRGDGIDARRDRWQASRNLIF
jgi:hypothetical protein